MKNLYLALAFVFVGTLASAQVITTDDDTVTASGDASHYDFYQNTYTNNPDTEPVQIEWERIVVDMPDSWLVSNCFPNCYNPPVDSGSYTAQPGEAVYTNTHFYPDGEEGTGIVILRITEVRNPGNPIDVVFVGTANQQSTSASSLVDKNAPLSLYPNPATDKMVLKGDLGKLRNIRVLNAIGSLVEVPQTVLVPTASKFDVSVLPTGIYILAAETTDGKSVRMRFVKR